MNDALVLLERLEYDLPGQFLWTSEWSRPFRRTRVRPSWPEPDEVERAFSNGIKFNVCTGRMDDGAALVDRTFGGETPLLAINPRSTASAASKAASPIACEAHSVCSEPDSA